jgi:hypothetical protein
MVRGIKGRKVKLQSKISEKRVPSATHKAYFPVNVGVIMNNEQVKVWKEATVVLYQSEQGLTKAKKEISHGSRFPRQDSNPETPRIQSSSFSEEVS